MIGIETSGREAVPDRAMSAGGGPGPGDSGGRAAPPAPPAAPSVPVAILLAGFALNAGWLVLLGWAAFRTIRWLFA